MIENFHNPPQDLQGFFTAARAMFDQQLAKTVALIHDDHFSDDNERLWLCWDALLDPLEGGAPAYSEDHCGWLAMMASLALMALARKQGEQGG